MRSPRCRLRRRPQLQLQAPLFFVLFHAIPRRVSTSGDSRRSVWWAGAAPARCVTPHPGEAETGRSAWGHGATLRQPKYRLAISGDARPHASPARPSGQPDVLTRAIHPGEDGTAVVLYPP